jgi:hypothetical protein
MLENPKYYLTSKETKKELKINDCDLAHVRNSGKLQFMKKGNAYLYLKSSIEDFKSNIK